MLQITPGYENQVAKRFYNGNLYITLERENQNELVRKESFLIKFQLKKQQLGPETGKDFGHLENLWKKKTFADVLFKIDGQEIQAHTLLVSSGSPVLAAMFQNDFKENRERVVEIDDIEADVMEHLLRFLYTGLVDQEKVDVRKLLIAADKYGIESLKVKCAECMKNQLKVENAIDFLVLSKLLSIQSLEEIVLKFMRNYSREVLSLEEWPEFMKNETDLCLKAIQAMAK